MGNCFAPNDSQPRNKVFQEFYYLYREKKYLLRIADDSISKTKFENSIKIRSDSGVGYLNDGRIIVAGGTDSAGCLTNTAYIINSATGQILHISHLPVASKEGAFFHYKTFVYYVGGIIDAEDEEVIAQEQAAPIMKYFLKEGYWEVFLQKQENKIGLHDYLMRKLNNGEDDEEIEVKMREIIYPGTFMIGSKIYFINGQRMSSKGILTSLRSVFSIDLEVDDFNFTQESFKSPLKVFRPVCGSHGNQVFITGGLKPSSKSCSKKTYIFTLSTGEPRFTEIPGLQAQIGDTYPVISTGDTNIVISYPSVAMFNTSTSKWLHFEFEEKEINRNDIKYTTPVLEIMNFVSDEAVRREGQFSTKYKNLVRTVDSDEVESGQSMSEPERLEKYTLKLPEGLLLPEGFVLPEGLFMTNDHESSINSHNRHNLSDSSVDLTVDHRIDIPMHKQSFEGRSHESSVNLSDREEPVKFKKNIAPMALPAPNIQPKKQNIKIDSESSEEFSEKLKKAKKVKQPHIKVVGFRNEKEVEADDSIQAEKDRNIVEIDSSEFDFKQSVHSPAKTPATIQEYPKEVFSGNESPSPEINKKGYPAKSSSSSKFEFESPGNVLGGIDFINKNSDHESSDFDFGTGKKSPEKKVDNKDSEKSSLNSSVDKIELHQGVQDLSNGHKKIHSGKAAEAQAADKLQGILKKPAHKEGLGADKPKQAVIPKSDNKYVDPDFEFESPSIVGAPKPSNRGKHGQNKSPLKPKPIHLKKVGKKEADSARRLNEPDEHQYKGSDSDFDEEEPGLKINAPQRIGEESPGSFESVQKISMPKDQQDSESESESEESKGKGKGKSSNINQKKSNIIAMNEPSPRIDIDLSAENSIVLEYELQKDTTVQVIQLITKELEIESTPSAGLKVLFDSYGKVSVINCKLFEDILMRVLPKTKFRITLLSNVLRKLYGPLNRKKIENERLLEIYHTAGITADTTLIEKDVVCFCVSKAISAIISE